MFPFLRGGLVAIYFVVLLLLTVYGLHRYVLVLLYLKNKRNSRNPPPLPDPLPAVTVQLPLYNERYVVERLIDAVCGLRYPRSLLEIQVLDDSTDDTRTIARRKVEEHRRRGVDIGYLHRKDRCGFKAGALREGLLRARGEFVAVFDADFLPREDFLLKTVSFFSDPRVGMVQSRWGHVNRDFSLLTKLQSVLLDGHFVIEHTARNFSGRFFNFNGTAGIWRKRCIESAGGWEHDTLTEDLDLSYRAQLRGWHFVYLPALVVPAELPSTMNAFKTQQHRWAKGSIQTGKKLLPRIWKSRCPTKVKMEATLHLTSNTAYLLMIVFLLMLCPTVRFRYEWWNSWWRVFLFDFPLFLSCTFSVYTFYLFSQREVYPDWITRLRYLPLVTALGVGISLNNARAVVEALINHDTPFLRTPKYAIRGNRGEWKGKRYIVRGGTLPLLEIAMGLYFAFLFLLALRNGLYLSLPFLLLFQTGFLYVGVLSLFQSGKKALPPPDGRAPAGRRD